MNEMGKVGMELNWLGVNYVGATIVVRSVVISIEVGRQPPVWV